MQSWPEIREWRTQERRRLVAARISFRGAPRKEADRAIAAALAQLVPQGVSLGFFWPIRGEPDLRVFASGLREKGAILSLPVVVEKRAPVEFHTWSPDAPMVSGLWDIPVPEGGERVRPEVLLIPLVGFDERCYRLGYGAGYYDRTLAMLSKETLAIGVGYEFSNLPTIHPQPHDIPMRTIVTEARAIQRCSQT